NWLNPSSNIISLTRHITDPTLIWQTRSSTTLESPKGNLTLPDALYGSSSLLLAHCWEFQSSFISSNGLLKGGTSVTSVVDPYDLLKMLEEEIKIIMSSDFEVEVTSTNQVPTTDDSGLTYPDLDNKRLKCKTVETCVLYIDIRKSTDLNISK